MIVAIYVRIPVATLCSLLAFVSSASAEYAWVMWQTVLEGPTGSPTMTQSHQVMAAYESKAQCETLFPPQGSVKIFEVTHLQGKDYVWSRYCLPDTVDPRGTKGK